MPKEKTVICVGSEGCGLVKTVVSSMAVFARVVL